MVIVMEEIQDKIEFYIAFEYNITGSAQYAVSLAHHHYYETKIMEKMMTVIKE